MAKRNTHRKPKEGNTGRKIAAGAVVAGTGLGASVLATGASSAATLPQWEAIAQCESGNDWAINHSSDGLSVGGLQFQNPSWQIALQYLNAHGYDTSTWTQTLYQGMPRDQVPTKEQTILAGEALLAVQGSQAWVCKGVGLSASMFEGGPAPYGPATTYSGSTPVDVAPVVVPPSKSGSRYTVESGDTLYGIAKAHGEGSGSGNWHALYQRNRAVVGSNPDLIYPGQVLRLVGKSAPPPVSSTAEYQRPVPGPITQGFHNPGNYTLGYHTGVDFRAAFGTPVHAANGGTIVDSDTSAAYGTNVQILNDDGTYALYAHLSAKNVTVGQHVAAGYVIGNVGSTGNSSGAHLHFEIRIHPLFAEGNFVDPADWLRAHGVTP